MESLRVGCRGVGAGSKSGVTHSPCNGTYSLSSVSLTASSERLRVRVLLPEPMLPSTSITLPLRRS